MREANKIAKHLINISGVNVFENSRKRKYVEVRSLLTFILRTHFEMKFYEIRDFYKLNGKSYDHATAIYSYKAFEINRRYNPLLDKYIDLLLIKIKDKAKLRKALVNHIIEHIQEQDLKKILKIVDKLDLKELAYQKN